MSGTPFYKMSGSGNDFVMLDGRLTRADQWPASEVRAICDRRRGVGADGLVILTPAASGTVRMAYWNSDGSYGAMCGNAALCSGRLAVRLGMIPPGEFCLLTDAGMVRVRSLPSGEDAEINLPDFDAPVDFQGAARAAGERWMAAVSVGVPHLVIRVDDVEAVDVPARGRLLRFDSALGPAGANVNFVSPEAAAEGAWLIRTYERGVEGETLACGTGTVAAAAALAARAEARLPLRFRSRGGLELRVRGNLGPQITGVWLGGEGRLLSEGLWKGG